MRIVHLQTTIQTVFGVMDDEGNVSAQEPIVATVPKFAPEAFAEAYGAIGEKRDELAAAAETE